MINPDTRQIKIIDFGISTFYSKTVRMTKKVGTPLYMAPEIFLNDYGPE